jgi:hypothetical protein
VRGTVDPEAACLHVSQPAWKPTRNLSGIPI